MIYRGPCLYDLATPPPPPPHFRQPTRPASHRKTEKERQLVEGGGGEGAGEEPNHTTAIESLVLFKSFNTLWGKPTVQKVNNLSLLRQGFYLLILVTPVQNTNFENKFLLTLSRDYFSMGFFVYQHCNVYSAGQSDLWSICRK